MVTLVIVLALGGIAVKLIDMLFGVELASSVNGGVIVHNITFICWGAVIYRAIPPKVRYKIFFDR